MPQVTPSELEAIAAAVQWAGHFATLDNCSAAGPAFSAIRTATRIVEAHGAPVYHALATRDLIDATA